MSGVGYDDGQIAFYSNDIATLGLSEDRLHRAWIQAVRAGWRRWDQKHDCKDCSWHGSHRNHRIMASNLLMGFGAVKIVVGMLSAGIGQGFRLAPGAREKRKKDSVKISSSDRHPRGSVQSASNAEKLPALQHSVHSGWQIACDILLRDVPHHPDAQCFAHNFGVGFVGNKDDPGLRR